MVKWTYKSFEKLTTDELYRIMVLRQRVFVVEQDCPYLDADGKDRQSDHLWAVDEEGHMAAYARIVYPGLSYKELSIGRFVTAPEHRGTGLGKMLMEKCLSSIQQHFGNVPIRVSAQEHLKAFYMSYGFMQVSDNYLEDDIPHIEMLWTQPI